MNTDILLKLGVHQAQIRDKFICQYCGEDGLASIENWRNSTVDHFIPIVSGGTTDLDNLKTSCRYCNSLKHRQLFKSVEEVIEYIRKRKEEDSSFVEKIRQAFRKT